MVDDRHHDALARALGVGAALALPWLESIAKGAPYLGICLGLQVLFDDSEEAPGERGLGIFRGHVKRNGVGPTYWSPCQVTKCVENELFEFSVGTDAVTVGAVYDRGGTYSSQTFTNYANHFAGKRRTFAHRAFLRDFERDVRKVEGP